MFDHLAKHIYCAKSINLRWPYFLRRFSQNSVFYSSLPIGLNRFALYNGYSRCGDAISARPKYNSKNALTNKRYLWKSFNLSTFGKYSVVKKPSDVVESEEVPPHIIKPSYADTGSPLPGPVTAEIKSKQQIDGMRKACHCARLVLDEVGKHLKIGLTTEEIDLIVRAKSFETNSYPSTLNYRGFPKSCCTSVNNVACHGIPDTRPLEDGDILSVDITVFHEGFHGDCCETYLIGDVDPQGKHLVETARKCRDLAIEICGPGVPFSNIGIVVEGVAREEELTVVPAFIGHGIGEYFHGAPDIYHCYNDFPGVMNVGMTFTVEPVITQGSREVIVIEDGWSALMIDNSRAAQFEHTILITEEGHDILTCYS